MTSLEDLKNQISQQLTSATDLRRPEGLATGVADLDGHLLWGGIPKSGLTAFIGELGLGSTSLWLGAACSATQKNRRVAWIEQGTQIFPPSLWQRQIDLSRFVFIEAPQTEKKLLWLLNELMASTLFDLIGCDLGEMNLREHQLRKLQAQARQFQIALVMFSHSSRFLSSPAASVKTSIFSLIISFQNHHLTVERALHRPAPFRITRRMSDACFIANRSNQLFSQNTSKPKGLGGFLQGLEPRALPRAADDA